MPRQQHNARLGWLACLGLLLWALVIVWMVTGCAAAGRDQTGLALELLKLVLSNTVGGDQAGAKIGGDAEAGRDVNEPVTGWILAAAVGLFVIASLPVGCYILSHRSNAARAAVDWLKGKHCKK